jgi:hypothetical protein
LRLEHLADQAADKASIVRWNFDNFHGILERVILSVLRGVHYRKASKTFSKVRALAQSIYGLRL